MSTNKTYTNCQERKTRKIRKTRKTKKERKKERRLEQFLQARTIWSQIDTWL